MLSTKLFCYDQLIILKCSSRSRSSQGQGHIKVKVIQGQGYLRSRLHKVRSFKFKVTQGQDHLKVKAISRHSHFEVRAILESNGNVFRFLSQSGQLAFIRMLIITCCFGFLVEIPMVMCTFEVTMNTEILKVRQILKICRNSFTRCYYGIPFLGMLYFDVLLSELTSMLEGFNKTSNT